MQILYQIQQSVAQRALEISSSHADWPCRKGCDDCCRSMAAPPRISKEEWQLIAAALEALPAETAGSVRGRIAESASASRPVTCPLLDSASGACLVYEARPVACRAYGFYADRQYVLGCSRIEAIAQQRPDIVWGNHAALEDRILSLGASAALSDWLLRRS